MPVSVESAISGPFIPNGATTSFPFTFKAVNASEVAVVDQDGAALSSALYTVTLDDDEGGSVDFSVAPDAADYDELYIVSAPALTQPSDFDNSGTSYNPASLTRALDRGAVRDLRLKLLSDASIRVPLIEVLGELPAAADRANQYLKFDATGQPGLGDAQGAKGDPGGNPMSIGLFADAATLTIPAGYDMVRTNGYSEIGAGVADYVEDGTVDAAYVAANSLTSFLDAGGRGFRLVAENGYPHAKSLGVKLDGTTDDKANLETAFQVVSGLGLKTIQLSGTAYLATAATLDDSNITAVAKGATFTTGVATANQWLTISGSSLTFEGLYLVSSAGVSSVAYVNVTGANVKFTNGCIIEDASGALSGPQMFAREGADGFEFSNSKFVGHKAAIDVRANRAQFSNSRFENSGSTGGDDCIAVKAIGVAVDNLLVTACDFQNYANFIGVGTQIGTLGADDTTRAGRSRGGVLANCTGRNCGVAADLKPGTSGTVDYRWGLVEGYRFDNLSLYDDSGAKLSGGISITAGRAALVQDIKATNISVNGRCAAINTGSLFSVWCRNFGAPALLKKISLSGSWFDPYLGVANGVGGAPGHPAKFIVNVQNDNSGTFEDICFPDIEANGCSSSGCFVDAGMDDAVSFGRLRLSNINTGASSSNGGIAVKSRIRMTSPDVSLTFPAGNTANQSMPYVFPTTGSGDVLGDFLTDEIYLVPQIASGATPTFYPWVAKRRCQIIEILMLTTDTVAQDATNNLTLQFTNMDGSGVSFGNWSNNTTGATGSRKRSGLTAGAWTTLWHARDVTDSTDRVEQVFIRGGRLRIVKTRNGTDPELNNVRLLIRAAPC